MLASNRTVPFLGVSSRRAKYGAILRLRTAHAGSCCGELPSDRMEKPRRMSGNTYLEWSRFIDGRSAGEDAGVGVT
jgi:hypothetical protein